MLLFHTAGPSEGLKIWGEEGSILRKTVYLFMVGVGRFKVGAVQDFKGRVLESFLVEVHLGWLGVSLYKSDIVVVCERLHK